MCAAMAQDLCVKQVAWKQDTSDSYIQGVTVQDRDEAALSAADAYGFQK